MDEDHEEWQCVCPDEDCRCECEDCTFTKMEVMMSDGR